ncbi:DUF4354 family protein [Moellerella wisconsensis]|uniref:Uncharacterized protein n=1 Tax=Moellerella wisconsensis ATCC 35017 TaxID=1354267 RepID=A0A0N1KIM1_9GAMM|nr:DUF4354 family protein [Moellerella wisconsensis]KPD02248.1 hypothetical protein M992_2243 [Moellerella wisconsensis ATCC 35017]VFS53902.1 Uncharacterised protein [Moellerella wisconsensis]
MKKTLGTLCLLYLSCSGQATTLNVEKNSLSVETFSSKNGTLVINGQALYERKLAITVVNRGESKVELTGFSGCYKAFDKQGKRYVARTTQLDLLGSIEKNAAKWGEISIVGKDDSVYKAIFVEWSSDKSSCDR